MTQKKNNLTGIALGCAVSLALLFFLFRDIEWDGLWAYLSNINLLYLPLIIIGSYLSYWIRALRWRHLLPQNNKHSNQDLIDATAIGIMASWVLPLRAGEIIRPWALSQNGSCRFSGALASVVVERVFDVLTLFLFIAIAVAELPEVPELVSQGGLLLLAVAGSILVVMLFAYLRGEKFIAIIEGLLGKLLKNRQSLALQLTGFVREFVSGLRSISSFLSLLKVLAYSLLLWLTFIAVYWATLCCFNVFTSPFLPLLITVVIALAIAAPSSPGFVGTFQFGCLLAITTLSSYPKEFAIAYSVFSHLVQASFGVIFGLWVLRKKEISFSSITNALSHKGEQ